MSASSILCRLRYKGHITNVEYQKLMDAKNKGKQTIPKSVIEDIRREITNVTFTGDCEGYQLGFNYGLAKAVEIIDSHIKAVEE